MVADRPGRAPQELAPVRSTAPTAPPAPWTDRPAPLRHRPILGLLDRVAELGLDFIETEILYTCDGTPGSSLGQGL